MDRAANAVRVRDLLDAGMSSREIARETGLSYGYVRDLLTDPAGEACRRRHEKARRRCEACGQLGSWSGRGTRGAEVLCQACITLVADKKSREAASLYADGMSTYAIAERLGLSPSSIKGSLTRAGVQFRSKSEARKMVLVKKKAAARANEAESILHVEMR